MPAPPWDGSVSRPFAIVSLDGRRHPGRHGEIRNPPLARSTVRKSRAGTADRQIPIDGQLAAGQIDRTRHFAERDRVARARVDEGLTQAARAAVLVRGHDERGRGAGVDDLRDGVARARVVVRSAAVLRGDAVRARRQRCGRERRAAGLVAAVGARDLCAEITQPVLELHRAVRRESGALGRCHRRRERNRLVRKREGSTTRPAPSPCRTDCRPWWPCWSARRRSSFPRRSPGWCIPVRLAC